MDAIDFVMLWVDDSDPVWQAAKNRYAGGGDTKTDARDARYRDWDNLRYWFRAVERFAPWVNRIYFITCGHVPAWLNLEAEKLVHISHADYMPAEFLPTFSANPIELNLCRIPELSEHIVFFNDDMFLCRSVEPELFFRNGLPVHQARLHAVLPQDDGVMPYIHLNDMIAINRHFNLRDSIRQDGGKWFSVRKNGVSTVIQNLFNSRYIAFPGFANEHLPVPLLKSVMQEVWEAESELLYETSLHKFRDMRDVNQYIFRYWQLASGRFEPARANSLGMRFTIREDNTNLCDAVRRQAYPMVCLNDGGFVEDSQSFTRAKRNIVSALQQILPEKSSFEKQGSL